MTTDEDYARKHGLMRVPRSRGFLSGLLLVLLGIWGALIPFIGPYFHYAYTPGTTPWTWTAGRFWLEVLPGIAAIISGFLLATTANRAVGVFAGWLGSAAGAWFLVGPVLGRLVTGSGNSIFEGAAGVPAGGVTRQVWEQIGFFSGLGAAILFLAAQALGRFTVRSVRDYKAVARHHDETTSDTNEQDAHDEATLDRRTADRDVDRATRRKAAVVAPASDAHTVTDVPTDAAPQPAMERSAADDNAPARTSRRDGGATRL